jgi:hypothetical protein
MPLSTLDMSRYAFLEDELNKLSHDNPAPENKNLIANYLDNELSVLKIKKTQTEL